MYVYRMFFTSGRMTTETIVVDPEKLLFSDCGFKLWIFDNQSGNKTSDSRRSTAGAMSAKKKSGSEALRLPEVHASGAEDRIDPVSFDSFQAVMVYSMFTFQVTYFRFDRRTALHPVPETRRRSSATPLVHVNLDIACGPVTTIAHVHKDMPPGGGDPFNP